MKKILITILIYIFCCTFSLASDYSNSIFSFNLWLEKNGYDYRVGCENEKTRNILCYDKKNKPLWTNKKNNLDVRPYKGRWGIPFNKNPNKDTLIYYNYKNLFSHNTGDSSTLQWDKYFINPSKKPYNFKIEKINNNFLDKQMQSKAILSYLYFEKDKIIIDELTPKNMFGEFVDDDTKLRSNSVGKTMISYVLGHAICAGYINSVESKISDWPLVKNTLYEDQKIIDLLNMSSGDQKYVYDSLILNNGKQKQSVSAEADTKDIYTYMKLVFENSKKSKKKYNYNIINTNLIFNYVLFKSGADFQKILDATFKDKAKIKNSVYFFKVPYSPQKFGNANSMFYATRYDYLRIAKAMMDDYQNQTCVGKYLKEIHEKRIKKSIKKEDEPQFNRSKSYGGQFHMDYPGLENKIVFGMGGYGGQAILIDMENSRIVVLNSVHYNNSKYKYDAKKLLLDPIKNGIN